MHLLEQTSAPKLSPFCGVHNTYSFLVFMLKAVEQAGHQSNHKGKQREEETQIPLLLRLDESGLITLLSREHPNPWDSTRAPTKSLFISLDGSVLLIVRAHLKNQKANEQK